MHLPKATRRHITYATAIVLVAGGAVLAVKLPAKPGGQAQAIPQATTASLADVMEPNLLTESMEKPGKPPVAASVPANAKTEEAQPQEREKVETYVVVEGDNIEAIAARFGLKSESLLATNNMDSEDVLAIGQELLVPKVDGVVYEIESGDNLWDLAVRYDVEYDDVVNANPELSPETIQPGTMVLIPGASRPSRRSDMVASRGVSRTNARKLLYWPTVGPITDEFGWRIHPVYGTGSNHDGMDLGVSRGTPLRAAGGGTVTMAGRYGGYGLVVRIDHGNGLSTQYAHMDAIDVSSGEWVEAGQHIGYSGNTGVSTGPHLHFMVMVDGTPTDPMPWLP